jgi:site-specific recombinase XerD
MSKRVKSRYTGVFYREIITNNKPDKVFYIVFKENGRSREVKVGKLSEGIQANYANQIRPSMINSIRLGEDLPTLLVKKQPTKVTIFDQITTKYFNARELHNRTNHQARSKYNSQLRPLIGSKDIQKISKNDILNIQKELAETRAPKTVNQYIQFIRAVYNYAIEEEIFGGRNPAQGIKEQKVDNKRERFLSIDEIKLLLDIVKEEPSLYLFTMLSLSTGGRLNTIMHIAKKDIDFENHMITLKDIKNSDTYGGFFNEYLKEILWSQTQNLAPNDLVISMNERTLRRRMSIILTQLFNQELDNKDRKNRVVVHTLRHTFASQLAINGTPIFTIQNLLNHKDIKQTLRYAKLSPESGKEMVGELMRSFS